MAKKGLEHLSLVDLQQEIRRRQRQLERQFKALAQKRERLIEQVNQIDAELAQCQIEIKANGGDPPGTRKRPRNESNLADALAEMLSERVMTVTEVAAAVQEAGYKTTSPNFRTIVNQTLLKDPRFKRIGRGQYTVKPGTRG